MNEFIFIWHYNTNNKSKINHNKFNIDMVYNIFEVDKLNIKKEMETIQKDIERINKLFTLYCNETNKKRKIKYGKMIKYLIRINAIKISLIIDVGLFP